MSSLFCVSKINFRRNIFVTNVEFRYQIRNRFRRSRIRFFFLIISRGKSYSFPPYLKSVDTLAKLGKLLNKLASVHISKHTRGYRKRLSRSSFIHILRRSVTITNFVKVRGRFRIQVFIHRTTPRISRC